MNKRQKLVWKFFLQQKTLEIIGLLCLIFIPFLLGHYIGDNKDIICSPDPMYEEDCGILFQWAEGLLYSVVIFIILFIVYFVIRANLEWAEERADKAIRKTKQKGKQK